MMDRFPTNPYDNENFMDDGEDDIDEAIKAGAFEQKKKIDIGEKGMFGVTLGDLPDGVDPLSLINRSINEAANFFRDVIDPAMSIKLIQFFLACGDCDESRRWATNFVNRAREEEVDGEKFKPLTEEQTERYLKAIGSAVSLMSGICGALSAGYEISVVKKKGGF